VPERDLINYIGELTGREALPWLRLGAGDDAAAIVLPGGEEVIISTDMLIEGVHFTPETGCDLVEIGRAHV